MLRRKQEVVATREHQRRHLDLAEPIHVIHDRPVPEQLAAGEDERLRPHLRAPLAPEQLTRYPQDARVVVVRASRTRTRGRGSSRPTTPSSPLRPRSTRSFGRRTAPWSWSPPGEASRAAWSDRRAGVRSRSPAAEAELHGHAVTGKSAAAAPQPPPRAPVGFCCVLPRSETVGGKIWLQGGLGFGVLGRGDLVSRGQVGGRGAGAGALSLRAAGVPGFVVSVRVRADLVAGGMGAARRSREDRRWSSMSWGPAVG